MAKRRRLRRCWDGGRHWWDPPSGRLSDYCTRGNHYRWQVVQVVEEAERQAERSWYFFPAFGALAALLLVVGTAFATVGSLGGAPVSKTDVADSTPTPTATFEIAGTEPPLLAYVAPTWSPPPAPSPTAAAPTGAGTCIGVATSTDTPAKAYARSRVSAREWPCLYILVRKESGWNPAALNAKSGACGLPQALPCSKMAPGWVIALDHGTWGKYVTVSATGRASPDDPNGQVDWLIRYVKSRYGTFYSAWVWWSTHAWY